MSSTAQAARKRTKLSPWQSVVLNEVASIVNGGTPKSKIKEYWGGNVQWLTPKEMGSATDRNVCATNRTITEEGLARSSANLVPPNSVILSTRAPIGHLAINKVDMAFNQGCRGIVPSTDLDVIFLYYFLLAHKQQLNALGTGTTFKELSATNLKSIQLPLPPLEEQKQIVAILDQAFAALDRARSRAEANLADAELLRRRGASRLLSRYEILAPKKLLGQLAEFRNGLNFSRHSSGATMKVVGVGDFKSNFSVPVDELQFATIDDQLSDSDRLCAGDVLAVRSNGNKELVGRVMVMGDADEVVSYSGFVIRIRLMVGNIDPRYLCYYMKSDEAVAHLRAGGGGANISNLNQRVLSSLPVSVPSLEEQRGFVDSMNLLNTKAKALIRVAESKLTDIADLRQSILQKAFAGELG